MESFCGSPFLDESLLRNTSHPDVTPCFQKTILYWLPCGYILFVAPFYLSALLRLRSNSIPHTCQNIIKKILVWLHALVAFAELLLVLYGPGHTDQLYPVHYIAPVLYFLSAACAVALLHIESNKGVITSGTLCIFWFLTLIKESIQSRSHAIQLYRTGFVYDPGEFVLSWVRLPVVFFIFAIYFVTVDKSPKGSEKTAKLSYPKFRSPVACTLLYTWGLSLIKRAYQTKLDVSLLWILPTEYTCSYNISSLLKTWSSELLKIRRLNPLPEVTTEDDSYVPLVNEEDNPRLRKSSLARALLIAFILPICTCSMIRILMLIANFCNPLFIRRLLLFVQDGGGQNWEGYLIAFGMFFTTSTLTVINQRYIEHCLFFGTRLKSTLMSAIYRKSLRLSSASRMSSTVGELVNLMAVDSNRYLHVMFHINLIMISPVQAGVALYFLWGILGPSALAGLVAIVITVPCNFLIIRASKKFEAEHLKRKDARMKMMNEVLNGIKVLKLYAWETSFAEKVSSLRKSEIGILKKFFILKSFSKLMACVTPSLIIVATFATYVLSSASHILDAEKAFVSIAYFNLMRSALELLPDMFALLVQLHVSHTRIASFLKRDELNLKRIDRGSNSEYAISIANGGFSWEPHTPPLLKRINLHIKPGSLVAVVGSVGCGKSSLLSALLGEMETKSGKITVKGSVAYVPQLAWIQHASLRENVLFQKEFREKFYWRVIEDCGLLPDLDILPRADFTEIGEKGINLSGGQKLRVSLARSVYSMADVYFLDDPLSAVDVHVGQHIFDRIIGPAGLLKHTTRVLVTHGIGFLSQVDHIIVMNDGRISEAGSYQTLLENRGEFSKFVENHTISQTSEDDKQLTEGGINGVCQVAYKSDDILSDRKPLINNHLKNVMVRRALNRDQDVLTSQNALWSSHQSLLSVQSGDRVDSVGNLSMETYDMEMTPMSCYEDKAPDSRGNAVTETKESEKTEEDDCLLVEDEYVESGNVKLSVVVAYLRGVGWWRCCLVLLLTTMEVGCSIGTSFWLADWSKDISIDTNSTLTTVKNGSSPMTSSLTTVANGSSPMTPRIEMRLGILGLLTVTEALSAGLGRSAVLFAGLRTSQVHHTRLLHNLLAAPMLFFDRTPVGRILNRFSGDIQTMDAELPEFFHYCVLHVLRALGHISAICSVTPWVLLVWLGLGAVYIATQRLYVNASRQLQRLLSVTKSPIYAFFSESVSGLSTIRAYGRQSHFIAECEARVDSFTRVFVPFVIGNRVMASNTEAMGSIVVLVAASLAVHFRRDLDAGLVGLAITSAITVTAVLSILVRHLGFLENFIVSVERVKEYIDTPPEAPRIIADTRPPLTWPASGKVQFKAYSTRYRPGLDLVLRGLSVRIEPGEKVGIVGRTGAGKSSLTLGLFRIIEAVGGTIVIDGIDVSDIGLHDLRSKLTIIPQDPVLFSGSLRMNLDPFDTHTDEQLWHALEKAHLKSFVQSTEGGLMFECSEGGANISVGQRQLICLARALLRQTRVLVMDEATAAVDLSTDELIQTTIRHTFADSTVLTIAHRLNTVLDYSKILVLERGAAVEYDSPANLLADENSVFYSMVNDKNS